MPDPVQYTPQQIAQFQAQFNAIDAAISTGALRTNYPGVGEVLYRSLGEMNAIRTDLATKIATGGGGTTPASAPSRVVMTSKSGW